MSDNRTDGPRLSTYLFSFFKGGIKIKKPTHTVTLADVVAMISGPTYEMATRELRNFEPDIQKLIKGDLDYVTFSGSFSPTRLVANLKQHSGLICLDFDKVANMFETRLQLQADPHTLLLFTSPTGTGLKMVVDVPGLADEPERHKGFFADIAIYIRQTYGLDVDASGSDVSRACFLPHDGQAFVNEQAESYMYRGLALEEHQQAKKPKTEHQIVKDADDVYRHVLVVVERIEAAKVNITDDEYHNNVAHTGWLMLAFCMSTLGENGRDLFHRISQISEKYDSAKTDEKFNEAVAKCRFTTPWKFFDIAKQHGIDVSKPGSKKKEKPAKEEIIKTDDAPTVGQDDQDNGQVAVEKAKPKEKKEYVFETVDYRDYGIWIWGTKNWICVAENFQIFVKYCTEDENEEKTWILEVVVRGRKEPIYIEITHDEFCSATKLKNKLASHRLALKLTDAYLGELWQHLFKMNFPQAQKVTRLGYHTDSGVFFFANKAVNGQVLEPDEFGIVTAKMADGTELCLSMPVVKKKRQHLFTLKPGDMTFNIWFSHLVQIHKYDNAIIPACFYLMSLFRDLIVKHTSASPILYLKGGASSGKSSLVRSLCRLFSLHEAVANLKSKNTEAGLVRVMSQASNSLIWMDEYNNEFPFEGLLQSAYDDNGYIKADENSSSGVDTVDIYSALALTSNYIPENPIFFSRCVFVPIVEQQKTDDQVEAFARFRDVEQDGLSCVTLEMLAHRPLIAQGVKQAYDDLYNALKEAVRHDKPVERLISNMARVLCIPYILQVFGKIQLQFEVEGDDDVLERFVEIGSKAILRQHQVQSEKTALSEFFELMQNQYEQGGIQEDVHFRFEGDMVFLRFPSLYTIYAQRYRQTFWKAPADRDTLKQEMIAFEGANDPDKFFKNIRFMPGEGDDANGHKRSVSGSCAMTYSKLSDALGIDWKGRRLEKAER
ncbi:BT4734/BF3469 family protein [Spirosoma horti]